MTAILDSDQPTADPSLVLADELIDWLAMQYHALPRVARRRLTFERFLIYRNGGLFQKLRQRPHHRRGVPAQRAIQRSRR
jgi:hypothetical protein